MKRTAMKRHAPKRKPPSMQDLAHPKPKTYPFNPEFLTWLRARPCVACGRWPGNGDHIEAAHLDSRRYGDEGNAVSLCGSSCHRDGEFSLHRIGRVPFQRHWKLHLRARARAQFADFQAQLLGNAFA